MRFSNLIPTLGVAIGLGLAVALGATGARAQQGPAPVVSPLTGKPETIQVPNATPTHLEAARDLVAVTGLGASFLQIIPNLMAQINSTITTTRPELAPDMKKTLDELAPEFGKLPQDMVDSAARLYTAVLNEKECKDAVVFFQSPTGKKFIDVQPTIIGNLGPVLRNWQQEMSVKMMARVREEMKKKGHEI